MSTLPILSKNEQKVFVAEPTFTLQEKQYFFSRLLIRTIYSKIKLSALLENMYYNVYIF